MAGGRRPPTTSTVRTQVTTSDDLVSQLNAGNYDKREQTKSTSEKKNFLNMNKRSDVNDKKLQEFASSLT